MKAIMFAAPRSQSGKTAVTCAFLAALLKRGMHPLAMKCGPDFIDPMYHRYVLGVPGINLDLFFLDRERLLRHYLSAVHQSGGDIAVVEGVMGYYDGLSGASDAASSFAVGRALDIPAVLIIDAKGASLTLAALIRGMAEFRKDSGIRGIILNRVSKGTAGMLSPVIERETGIRVYGYVPEAEEFRFGSRHLGLLLPEEIEGLSDALDRAGSLLEETLDISGLLSLAEESHPEVPEEGGNADKEIRADTGSGKIRIAMADDEAFCFHYQENDDLIRGCGAEIVPFSPIHDKTLPPGISGLLFIGGYPELAARELSENTSMRESVRKAVESGMPVLAECGGFLYLHRELQGEDKKFWPMAGIYPERAFRTERLTRFGYITVTLPSGEEIKGHEFHYWESENPGDSCEAVKPSGKSWRCIRADGAQLAGFPHLYYPSNPSFIRGWLDACLCYAKENEVSLP